MPEKNDTGSPTDSQHGDKPDVAYHEDALVLETAFAKDSRAKTIRTFKKAVAICLMAAFAGLHDGFQMQLPGGLIANAGFVAKFATKVDATGAPVLDPNIISLWGGLQAMTNLISVGVAGFLADYIGRKGSMYVFSTFLLLGTILEMTAQNWRTWLAAKTLFGMGLGMVFTTQTSYISEVAPFQIRGGCIALFQSGFALGQLTASIGLQIVNVNYPMDYLKAIYAEWATHGIWLIFLILLPESPWYYARKKDHANAKKMLQKINGGVAGYDIEHEYAVMQNEIEHEEAFLAASTETKWTELFKGANGRRTAAASIAIAFQQMVGGAVFFTYFTYFFQISGFPDPFRATVIVFVLLNVFIIVSLFTSELLGRRTLILWGGTLLVLFNLILGIIGSLPTNGGGSGQKAALAVTCLWMVVYASSSAPVGYIAAAEMGSPRLRQKTAAIAYSSWQVLNLAFSFAVPQMLAVWAVKTAYFYAAFSAIGMVVIWFIFPETSGRTYAELDEMFEDRKLSARRFASYKTQLQRSGLKGDN